MGYNWKSRIINKVGGSRIPYEGLKKRLDWEGMIR
jgi:hypothetical protein